MTVFINENSNLTCKGKLHTESEIADSGWIAVVCKQWCISLAVVIEAHGQQSGECVIRRKTKFKSRVSTACITHH